jgi:hypothetical protein
MKVLILVPVWQRPEITKIWIEGVKWFKTQNVTILTILSQEDPFFKENLSFIKKICDFCYFQNKPLGQKINAGIEYALEAFDFDYLMNLGSDDLIHPAIWNLYDSFLNDKIDFFGLDKIYFYEPRTGKLGHSLPYVWGAGRMISRRLLEMIRSKGEFLYKSQFSRGLDCNSMDRIKDMFAIGYKQIETGTFPYVVDIKTEVGINDFILMQKMYELVDFEILRQFYPEHIINLLDERSNR